MAKKSIKNKMEATLDRPLSNNRPSVLDSKTLTKKKIAQAFTDVGVRTYIDCHIIVEKLLAIMKKAIKEDKHLLISSFGSFECYAKNDRKGRNPATGERMMLPGRNVVVFRISRIFRRALNQ